RAQTGVFPQTVVNPPTATFLPPRSVDQPPPRVVDQPAPDAAKAAPDKLAVIDQKLDALSKALTGTTADPEIKIILGGAVIAGLHGPPAAPGNQAHPGGRLHRGLPLLRGASRLSRDAVFSVAGPRAQFPSADLRRQRPPDRGVGIRHRPRILRLPVKRRDRRR